MEFLTSLYTELLWRPLFNGLIFFYTAFPLRDLGLAIILLTIVIRALLLPFTWKMQKAQREMARIQPLIKELQERHKGNREEQAKALMELYREHKVNPFSGCLVMILQIPILIALFHVFQSGFDSEGLVYLYSFISNPGDLSPFSFGILDLSKGNIYLGIPAALTQYWQTRLTGTASPFSADKKDMAGMLRWQALYLFPILILVWSYTLPSALTLYWTVLNIFGILQELIVNPALLRKGGTKINGAGNHNQRNKNRV